MHVRLATTRDLHRLAQITTTSLMDDPTFDYTWSKRHEFPKDNFFWQLTLKECLYDPRQTFLVIVLDAADHAIGENENVVADIIISYAVWGRIGDSAAARRRREKKNTWQNLLDSASALSITHECF